MIQKCQFIMVFTFIIASGLFCNSVPDDVNNRNENGMDTKINFALSDKTPDWDKIDTNLKITHAVFAGITYASLWSLDAVGSVLLYYAFTNPQSDSYASLKYSHMGIAIFALLSFATVVTLAFTKLGLKIKNKFEIRKTHLTAAVVTLSFYVLELTSIILSAVFFGNNLENAKWVGLAHGITCGATTIAFSVSFITIFF